MGYYQGKCVIPRSYPHSYSYYYNHHRYYHISHFRDDPRLIARFATGVYSPRISKLKLGKHDSFGATIHCDWLEILQRAQQLM